MRGVQAAQRLPNACVFFQNIVQRGDCQCKLELTAFLKCCDLMDLIMSIPLGIVSPMASQDAVEGFLEACTNACWERFIKQIYWILEPAKAPCVVRRDSNMFSSWKKASADKAFCEGCFEHCELRKDNLPRNGQPWVGQAQAAGYLQVWIFPCW